MLKRSMLIASLLFLLGACSPSKPIPTAKPSIEAQPVVANPSTVPTKTTVPATATLIPSPTGTSSPTATLPPTGYGPDNFPKDVNPLTGIKVADAKVLDRRPLGIKVNIYPRGTTRPPFGLSFADIVYEYYHNDGASRYHAIFYGEDAKEVGPIRSGRLLDDSLIRMYKSIFVFGGASVEIESRFESADYAKRMIIGGYDNLPCPPTKENPLCTFEPNGRHNLVGDTSLIRQYAAATGIDSTRQNLNGMYFQTNSPSGGKPGKQVYTRYSWDMYNRWDYDATTGRYMLFGDAVPDENGGGEKYDPMIDRVTNQQIGAENVVELIVPDEYAQRPPNEIVDILLSGTGAAYAFRDGQVYQVTWNRPTVDSVLYLTNPDGTRFPFKPGKTWFEVVNKESTIKEENGAYRFTYFIRR